MLPVEQWTMSCFLEFKAMTKICWRNTMSRTRYKRGTTKTHPNYNIGSFLLVNQLGDIPSSLWASPFSTGLSSVFGSCAEAFSSNKAFSCERYMPRISSISSFNPRISSSISRFCVVSSFTFFSKSGSFSVALLVSPSSLTRALRVTSDEVNCFRSASNSIWDPRRFCASCSIAATLFETGSSSSSSSSCSSSSQSSHPLKAPARISA
mmetsp:Transcript_20949/g.31994  ORF Transcript_20949/g.31994 Transcript_20949/m.31994 type:complete len:208 (-) Transcript_20949:356-979(-)